MRPYIKLNQIIVTVLSLAGLLLVATPASAATTASFSISGAGNYTVGDTFSVTISENSSTQEVNAIEADMHYDASKLQVTGLSVGSFTACPTAPSASAGTIKFSCAALGDKFTGSHTVGTIGFKALTAGSTTVYIMFGSAIVDANIASQNDWNQVLSNASYNFIAPASTPPPSSDGGNTTAPPPATTTFTNSQAGSTQTAGTTSIPQTTNSTAQSSDTTADNPLILGSTDTNTSVEPEAENQTTNGNTNGMQLLDVLLPLIIATLVAVGLIGGLLYTKREQTEPVQRGKKKASEKSEPTHKEPANKKRKPRK
jgi:hypothetical protein